MVSSLSGASSQKVLVMRWVTACIVFLVHPMSGMGKQFGNEDGKVHCFLLICKSRITLLNFVSIPRLELAASVLSVEISQQLKQEPEIEEDILEKEELF